MKEVREGDKISSNRRGCEEVLKGNSREKKKEVYKIQISGFIFNFVGIHMSHDLQRLEYWNGLILLGVEPLQYL